MGCDPQWISIGRKKATEFTEHTEKQVFDLKTYCNQQSLKPKTSKTKNLCASLCSLWLKKCLDASNTLEL